MSPNDAARILRGILNIDRIRFLLPEIAAIESAIDTLSSLSKQKPVAWRWLRDGNPEERDLGGSLCWDGTHPADLRVDERYTVQNLYAEPVRRVTRDRLIDALHKQANATQASFGVYSYEVIEKALVDAGIEVQR